MAGEWITGTTAMTGDYPYESISAEAVDSIMCPLGFDYECQFVEPFSTGLLGFMFRFFYQEAHG